VRLYRLKEKAGGGEGRRSALSAKEDVAMDNYYRAKGTEIGALVDRKNKQYGNSFNRAGDILTILYPDGVNPDQYRDMLAVVRVVDKLFRVAHGKQGDEDPWQDIAGYGLLGMGNSEIRKDCSDCMYLRGEGGSR
jgi:hypothetical protein